MRRRMFPLAFVLTALLASAAFAQEARPEAAPATPVTAASQQLDVAPGNQEVIDLLKAGMSPAVVIAKVKSSSSKFDTSPAALQSLKSASATDEVILAVIEAAAPKKDGPVPATGKRRVTDELTTKFRELQSSVVTVWSEIGQGTGFIFDDRGLVMTNQHVVGPSEYVSVQF
ncbi:MAG TPA: hypothetical protein VF611_12475, partial [Pyrinomonadaceae bacterium]